MSFRIQRDNPSTLDILTIARSFNIPIYDILPQIQAKGSLIYNTATEEIYVSNGTNWLEIGNESFTLPTSLQSIANVPTSGNEILYTTGTNTYTTSTITALGRNLLQSLSQNTAQSVLGTVVGLNVQAHSNSLDQFNSVSSTASGDKLVYNTGPGTFTTTNLTPLARTLLDDTTISQMRNTLCVVEKSLSSTNNAIALFNGTTGNLLKDSSVIINTNDISNVGNLTLTGSLNGVTTTELSQLQTINTTVIPTSAWLNMSTMDQSVSSTATPSLQVYHLPLILT